MKPYYFCLPLFKLALLIYLAFSADSCESNAKTNSQNKANKPHVVFVTGDEEYRSEESMPMIAEIIHRELGAEISVCYALDSLGYIDPNRNDHISGLEALKTADLVVMFTRFRALPGDELKYITDYVDSGRPIVGFRTSTHAFYYEKDTTKSYYNDEWPTKVFGQQWITHHGHFEDGNAPLTRVSLSQDQSTHPILQDVKAFDAYSWLYHVEGGEWSVYGDPTFLLTGKSLRSKHEEKDQLDQYPITNPIAWTKDNNGGRVFFTTLGHPYDFLNENMRRLAVNGIYWALGLEHKLQGNTVNVEFVQPYQPNNSGFGEKYKQGVKPSILHLN